MVFGMNSLRPTAKTWPLWAMIFSAAMLAGAHAFEQFGRMLPCPLCLRQREMYWAAITVAVIGFIMMRRWRNDRMVITVDMLLCLVFLTGAVVAGFHTGVEWGWWEGPADCSGGASLDALPRSLSDVDFSKRFATVSCTEAAWRMFGISMAGYNTLISLGLAVISAAFALKTIQLAPTPDDLD
ncbi:MAG: disulfide bond formation protein B [Ponticaulis sp.]|nr:disulfide bond formation protein B [Ponticaulis sp.]